VLLTANNPGQANGTADVWIDGVKVIRNTGITFVGPNESPRWEEVRWNPTWGGLNGTITAPFYAQMDHLYVSTK
jgi:hypothetical protein